MEKTDLSKKEPVRPISTSEPTYGIDDLYVETNVSYGFSVEDDVAFALDIMEKHETNSDILAQACQGLSDLTSVYINEESSRDIACKTTIEQGGIAKIIKAMKLHVNHDGIQQTCCDTLFQLLGVMNRDACDQIVAEDGIPCLVRAIRKHENNSHVQYKGMRALSGLIAINCKMCSLVADEGGIGLAVASVKEHTDCADVQTWGISLLSYLVRAYFHHFMDYAIAMENIVDCVLTAMRKHERDEGVQTFCCSMLSILSRDPSTCAFIVVAGGAECAINAMKQYTEISWLQSEGSAFLLRAGRIGEPAFSMAAAAA